MITAIQDEPTSAFHELSSRLTVSFMIEVSGMPELVIKG
jgi:hypothetical protein